jgi:hypothetical protein
MRENLEGNGGQGLVQHDGAIVPMTLDKQSNQPDRERELTLSSSVWFKFRGKISKKNLGMR